ncbi:hypothetical protein AB0L40_22530 [Patulibacter sp. NPDC049589]|uniref:hypothetical protein n=1 Tax=Patulibacter sp. NPDC049589 TaxID=3154731 RepID=UPI003438CDD9
MRMPVPGRLGRALRDGVLCGDAELGGAGPTFQEWLETGGAGTSSDTRPTAAGPAS